MTRAGLVAVRLRDLRLAEEFSTLLTLQRGSVVSTGNVLWADRTGRETRVQAVLVRFGHQERILLAELRVLVEAERPHATWTAREEELRWLGRLEEPGSIGKLGAVARRWNPGETRRRLIGTRS
jgi:hypothetical protein